MNIRDILLVILYISLENVYGKSLKFVVHSDAELTSKHHIHESNRHLRLRRTNEKLSKHKNEKNIHSEDVVDHFDNSLEFSVAGNENEKVNNAHVKTISRRDDSAGDDCTNDNCSIVFENAGDDGENLMEEEKEEEEEEAEHLSSSKKETAHKTKKISHKDDGSGNNELVEQDRHIGTENSQHNRQSHKNNKGESSSATTEKENAGIKTKDKQVVLMPQSSVQEGTKSQVSNISDVAKYPSLPIPQMIPLPLFYNSGESEGSAANHLTSMAKNTKEVEDFNGESGYGELPIHKEHTQSAKTVLLNGENEAGKSLKGHAQKTPAGPKTKVSKSMKSDDAGQKIKQRFAIKNSHGKDQTKAFSDEGGELLYIKKTPKLAKKIKITVKAFDEGEGDSVKLDGKLTNKTKFIPTIRLNFKTESGEQVKIKDVKKTKDVPTVKLEFGTGEGKHVKGVKDDKNSTKSKPIPTRLLTESIDFHSGAGKSVKAKGKKILTDKTNHHEKAPIVEVDRNIGAKPTHSRPAKNASKVAGKIVKPKEPKKMIKSDKKNVTQMDLDWDIGETLTFAGINSNNTQNNSNTTKVFAPGVGESLKFKDKKSNKTRNNSSTTKVLAGVGANVQQRLKPQQLTKSEQEELNLDWGPIWGIGDITENRAVINNGETTTDYPFVVSAGPKANIHVNGNSKIKIGNDHDEDLVDDYDDDDGEGEKGGSRRHKKVSSKVETGSGENKDFTSGESSNANSIPIQDMEGNGVSDFKEEKAEDEADDDEPVENQEPVKSTESSGSGSGEVATEYSGEADKKSEFTEEKERWIVHNVKVNQDINSILNQFSQAQPGYIATALAPQSLPQPGGYYGSYPVQQAGFPTAQSAQVDSRNVLLAARPAQALQPALLTKQTVAPQALQPAVSAKQTVAPQALQPPGAQALQPPVLQKQTVAPQALPPPAPQAFAPPSPQAFAPPAPQAFAPPAPQAFAPPAPQALQPPVLPKQAVAPQALQPPVLPKQTFAPQPLQPPVLPKQNVASQFLQQGILGALTTPGVASQAAAVNPPTPADHFNMAVGAAATNIAMEQNNACAEPCPSSCSPSCDPKCCTSMAAESPISPEDTMIAVVDITKHVKPIAEQLDKVLANMGVKPVATTSNPAAPVQPEQIPPVQAQSQTPTQPDNRLPVQPWVNTPNQPLGRQNQLLNNEQNPSQPTLNAYNQPWNQQQISNLNTGYNSTQPLTNTYAAPLTNQQNSNSPLEQTPNQPWSKSNAQQSNQQNPQQDYENTPYEPTDNDTQQSNEESQDNDDEEDDEPPAMIDSQQFNQENPTYEQTPNQLPNTQQVAPVTQNVESPPPVSNSPASPANSANPSPLSQTEHVPYVAGRDQQPNTFINDANRSDPHANLDAYKKQTNVTAIDDDK